MCGRARSPRRSRVVGPGASIRRASGRTSSARSARGCPITSSSAAPSTGSAAARSTPAPSGSSRTRMSTTTRSRARSRCSTSCGNADVAVDADVPSKALAIYAHPDDAEISAGGTLARWAHAGAEVHVAITTRGDKGTNDPDADPDALTQLRIRETDDAALVLGLAGHHHLDYPDGEIDDTVELRRELVRLVRSVRPDVVLGPDPTAVFFGDGYVNHRDHRITGWAMLDAVSPAAGNPHYFPELGAKGLAVHHPRAVPLSGTTDPTVWVDIGDTLERKIDAFFCHGSQLAETGDCFRDFLRESAVAAGRTAGVTYAEAFRRILLG